MKYKEDLLPVLDFPEKDLLISVDNLKLREEKNDDNRDLREKDGYFTRVFINGYSIKTGKRVISYDTKFYSLREGYCSAGLYIEDYNAICVGTSKGKISFFSVEEVLKHRIAGK